MVCLVNLNTREWHNQLRTWAFPFLAAMTSHLLELRGHFIAMAQQSICQGGRTKRRR